MIQKLAGSTNDNTPGIVVDDRSNSIFFKVNLVNDARRLEELFALLDTEPSVNPPMKASVSSNTCLWLAATGPNVYHLHGSRARRIYRDTQATLQ